MRRSSIRSKGIQGLVVPLKRDIDGNVVGVGIRTVNEQEFIVESSRIGQELNRHVFENVIVQGTFRERLDGETLIRVSNFNVLASGDNQ